MTDIIRKAVELADGWTPHGGWGATVLQGKSNQKALDALAAQLVRQVDMSGHWLIYGFENDIAIWEQDNMIKPVHALLDVEPDRTMNTLKAIVESGVLE